MLGCERVWDIAAGRDGAIFSSLKTPHLVIDTLPRTGVKSIEDVSQKVFGYSAVSSKWVTGGPVITFPRGNVVCISLNTFLNIMAKETEVFCIQGWCEKTEGSYIYRSRPLAMQRRMNMVRTAHVVHQTPKSDSYYSVDTCLASMFAEKKIPSMKMMRAKIRSAPATKSLKRDNGFNGMLKASVEVGLASNSSDILLVWDIEDLEIEIDEDIDCEEDGDESNPIVPQYREEDTEKSPPPQPEKRREERPMLPDGLLPIVPRQTFSAMKYHKAVHDEVTNEVITSGQVEAYTDAEKRQTFIWALDCAGSGNKKKRACKIYYSGSSFDAADLFFGKATGPGTGAFAFLEERVRGCVQFSSGNFFERRHIYMYEAKHRLYPTRLHIDADLDFNRYNQDLACEEKWDLMTRDAIDFTIETLHEFYPSLKQRGEPLKHEDFFVLDASRITGEENGIIEGKMSRHIILKDAIMFRTAVALIVFMTKLFYRLAENRERWPNLIFRDKNNLPKSVIDPLVYKIGSDNAGCQLFRPALSAKAPSQPGGDTYPLVVANMNTRVPETCPVPRGRGYEIFLESLTQRPPYYGWNRVQTWLDGPEVGEFPSEYGSGIDKEGNFYCVLSEVSHSILYTQEDFEAEEMIKASSSSKKRRAPKKNSGEGDDDGFSKLGLPKRNKNMKHYEPRVGDMKERNIVGGAKAEFLAALAKMEFIEPWRDLIESTKNMRKIRLRANSPEDQKDQTMTVSFTSNAPCLLRQRVSLIKTGDGSNEAAMHTNAAVYLTIAYNRFDDSHEVRQKCFGSCDYLNDDGSMSGRKFFRLGYIPSEVVNSLRNAICISEGPSQTENQ